jgi:hypothetical protein
MISAALYLLILSNPQFRCPLTSNANCKEGCSTCNVFNATTQAIVRFQREILKQNNMFPCEGNVIFPSDETKFGCSKTSTLLSCSDSVLDCAFSGFSSHFLDVCSSCVALEPHFIVQFVVSIMLFPLGVLFMTCNLLAWRSDSSDQMQLPRESECDELNRREEQAADDGRLEGSVPSVPSTTAKIIRKVEITLKGLTILNQFVKYTAQTVVFFLILAYSRPSCNQTSASSISSAQLTEQCSPYVNIQTQIFVMGCCAVIFLALLIFDFIVIRRNRLQQVAEPVAIIVISTCLILMIICSAQLVQVLNAEIRYICSDKRRVQSANFEIELNKYFCLKPQCSCETNIPSSARIVASSIVLDMLFVIFGAVGYARGNDGVTTAESVKLAEIKSS